MITSGDYKRDFILKKISYKKLRKVSMNKKVNIYQNNFSNKYLVIQIRYK